MTDQDKIALMTEALKLTLTFHKGGEWGPEQENQWYVTTGNHEATTRSLCNHLRVVLERTK